MGDLSPFCHCWRRDFAFITIVNPTQKFAFLLFWRNCKHSCTQVNVNICVVFFWRGVEVLFGGQVTCSLSLGACNWALIYYCPILDFAYGLFLQSHQMLNSCRISLQDLRKHFLDVNKPILMGLPILPYSMSSPNRAAQICTSSGTALAQNGVS